MKSIFLLIFVISFVSCNKQSAKIEQSLVAARENRSELEKALNYYKDDSLKLAAVHFLIENMVIYKFPQSVELEKLHNYTDSLCCNLSHFEREELLRKLTSPSILPSEWMVDLQFVDSEFIIQSIEDAFDTWKLPWAQNFSWNEFCEYLLPYKTRFEKPER